MKRKSKALAKHIPEEHIHKRDENNVYRKRIFIRMCEGEKDYVEEKIYDENMTSIVGKIIQVWDGSIGRKYIPHKKYGRVQKNISKLTQM